VVKTLTSSRAEVDELPGRRFDPSTGSVLALFGEEARGLPGGVKSPISRWGGEVSSVAGRVSDSNKVCDVLV
jgi:hypothetical protein